MKNRLCPHTYSKVEILNHILQKQKQSSSQRRSSAKELQLDFECSCPIVGCKKMVSANNLMIDQEMEEKLKLYHQQKALNSQQSSIMNEDNDNDDDEVIASQLTQSTRSSRKRGTIKEESSFHARSQMEED